MKSSSIAFLCSALLIIGNLVFLYAIVGYKQVISMVILPGLTVGILGFGLVITFAVLLTWVYITIINRRDRI